MCCIGWQNQVSISLMISHPGMLRRRMEIQLAALEEKMPSYLTFQVKLSPSMILKYFDQERAMRTLVLKNYDQRGIYSNENI